jgi:hypothetical protein
MDVAAAGAEHHVQDFGGEIGGGLGSAVIGDVPAGRQPGRRSKASRATASAAAKIPAFTKVSPRHNHAAASRPVLGWRARDGRDRGRIMDITPSI